jgi:hypothetical protein
LEVPIPARAVDKPRRIYLLDTDALAHIRERPDSEQLYDGIIRLAEEGIAKTIPQVFGELEKFGDVYKRLVPYRKKLTLNESLIFCPDVQRYLDVLGNLERPLWEQTGGKNPDPADPFLVATAAAHGYTVVTNESRRSPYKIPATCELEGINCRCISGPHFLFEVGIVTEIRPEWISVEAFHREGS